MFSVGHGLNDSQKVMGIIAAAMIAAHSMGLGMGINSISDLPDWVAFSCFTAISLGTVSTTFQRYADLHVGRCKAQVE